jgi:CHAT domain-containing protein
VVEELRRDIERLRVSIDVSGRDLARRFPAYAGLVNPGLATSAALSEALADDESFILIFGGETRTWIWALRRRRPVVFSSVPLSSTEIQRMVAALRRGLSLESGEVGDIPPFDVALAHQVYQSVLAPVASEWGAARRLIVAADGPLATVPLSMLSTRPGHALVDRDVLFDRYREVAWLARDYAVSSVPSASAFLALRRSSAVSAARKAFAGFGDPRFGRIAPRSPDEQGRDRSAHGARATRVSARASPRGILVTSVQHRGLPSLPETADEVRAIARALGANLEADVFLGVDASETRVKTMALDDRRLIVFATHGLVAGDFDGLTEPGLALSSPELTGESGEDGVLTMSEILGVKLNAEWVVLSACNTAAPDGSGAEAISGLGRAFLYAGARALLVTHWPVETTSARALTTTLFRLWSGTPAPAQAEALRRAMMVLVDEQGYRDTMGRMVFSYAHPVFWAPFAMIGDGGRGGVPRVAERIASAE